MWHPFGDPTDTLSWEPGPVRRGTLSIITSCIITTSLCVYTAVHLNIPDYRDRSRPWYLKRQNARKVGWLTLGVLAPELVAYTAFYQKYQAQRLLHDMKEMDPGSHPTDEKVRTEGWTLTHAFYALMGGFEFDVSGGDDFLPKEYRLVFGINRKRLFSIPTGQEPSRMMLTEHGLRTLAKHRLRLVLTLQKAEIKDKSKASGLAKAIVCLQTSWFILQIISRIAYGLPITLLELNTFAHCVCALLTYFFWWNKPLNIDEPTLISEQGSREALAYLYMVSPNLPHSVSSEVFLWPRLLGCSNLNEDFCLPDANRRFYVEQARNTGNTEEPLHTERPSDRPPDLPKPSDIRRWSLATNMLDQKLDNTIYQRVSSRICNWPSWIASPDHHVVMLCMMLASGLYGGLHLLAWDAPFRSAIQSTIWKVSAIFVATFGGLIFLAYRCEYLEGYFFRKPGNWFYARNSVRKLGKVFSILVFIGLPVYVSARGYLVVESFICLFYSPSKVYEVPQWALLLPHIV